jgi:hypothetical protein
MVKNFYKIDTNLTWKSLNRNGFYKKVLFNKKILEEYNYIKSPNLFDLTGYHNGSPISFLIKKNLNEKKKIK